MVGQAVHDSVPVTSVYVLAAQTVHDVAAAAEYSPAEHTVQEGAPNELAVPAGHFWTSFVESEASVPAAVVPVPLALVVSVTDTPPAEYQPAGD
jgi:hypothetical protein